MPERDDKLSAVTPQFKLESPAKLPIPTPKIDMAAKLERKWNTKNLGLRLGVDAVAAASAAALIAPVVSIIDKSVMENASGRATLLTSVKASLRTLFLRPHTMLFSKPLALIFMTYGGTYLTANSLDTATSTVKNKPATTVTAGPAKFVSSSTANVCLGIYKDQVYARMFGPAGVVSRVPFSSYSLFALRDCITIFASFNVPLLMGPVVTEFLPKQVEKLVSGHTIVQFVAPAAVQLMSTPPHLLGLDMYNRPGLLGWKDRWLQVQKNWAISVAARICRIVPAYGVGGVVNVKVRRGLMEKLV
ncbi:hypothetical protein UCRPA7_3422 [Phaeoacremonium minimum UCRPA7]|uniref:Sequence orphan n=1 Tax=Phaeoacremonium minimum (strain UCR-PA7) TaxID=1286976 RepID=R8BP69_PHAM7|nr:hypothetical protein UCRPA7_3422 [Phaeoacremonium minimum UCRPA7]EOO01136.1 hypothetical protein UCRPA7_3422 [Phaeoacremonium minimum UCRPA7]